MDFNRTDINTNVIRITNWWWNISDVVNSGAFLDDRRFPCDVFAVRRNRDVDGSFSGRGWVDDEGRRFSRKDLSRFKAGSVGKDFAGVGLGFAVFCDDRYLHLNKKNNCFFYLVNEAGQSKFH
jgi:hypothetical protein